MFLTTEEIRSSFTPLDSKSRRITNVKMNNLYGMSNIQRGKHLTGQEGGNELFVICGLYIVNFHSVFP
jgi:hypothetical protein